MCNILVVDDTPFWRDVTTDALRLHQHNVSTAANGIEALASLEERGADLIILDVDLPQLQGLSFLEQIRRDQRWKDLPVIMLTGDMQKERVLLAKKLGAVDYLLKARFSPAELLERVEKRIELRQAHLAAELSKQGSGQNVAPNISTGSKSVAATGSDMPQLLARDVCLARAAKAMAGRTLAGVVAEVVASANSPRIPLSELSSLIGRDAMLAARVLQASNSASNMSARGSISTLPEAVRVVGCSGIRNIAASLGVLDAMPTADRDGFNPIRSWQHSLAVAVLCERLAPADVKGVAYLVGLSHDLGEILFRSHFSAEYTQVLNVQKTTGLPLHRVELQMLGATHGELSAEILTSLGLPEEIIRPIAHFHQSMRTGAVAKDPLAKILRLAEHYAIGTLLAPSPDGLLTSITQAECRDAVGNSDPDRPNDMELRGEILALTAVYARLPANVLKAACEPFFPKRDTRILIVRDQKLSSFDPITAALQSMTDASVAQSLPVPQEMESLDGLVIIAQQDCLTGMNMAALEQHISGISLTDLPVLLLSKKSDDQPKKMGGRISLAQWPIPIEELANFIQSL